MKDARITLRLPVGLRNRLKSAARRTGTPESDLVRQAVENQLALTDPGPTAWEKAKKLGLIGAVRSTARDLSTNPKHFDGFGK